jgi:hypothetical protein
MGGAYECPAGHVQPKRPVVLPTLQLSIINQMTGQPFDTLEQVLKNYFNQELLAKTCTEEGCGEVQVTSSSWIAFHPQLFILQYKRFLGPGNKVKDPVHGTVTLDMNGNQYGLVGLLLHLEEEDATGHYMSVTR